MNIPKISQSLMKNFVDYLDEKVCGKYFEERYIKKTVDVKATPAMKLGIYFEYLCTGAIPRSGIVPEPERLKNGGIATDYLKAQQSAELFKQIISFYKIKVLKVNYRIETDDKNGVIDILAENGLLDPTVSPETKIIIDIKYSGLIENKWDEQGWETESLTMKDSLMIQGVHYKMLAKEVLGIEDIPFYFFVFNSKDPTDMKIIRQIVDELKYTLHTNSIYNMKQRLAREMEIGFKPIPDYRECKDCPCFPTCDYRAEMPIPINIYY